ncbi:MAG: menaquinone biosynthesis decarboxylase [Thermodesulfobacteriota bacterium]
MKSWYRNLSEYLETLTRLGELKVVDRLVSPRLEISRLIEAESKSPDGGRALFFPRVEGSAFPVAANLFGSHRRIRLALGVKDLDDLGARVRRLMNIPPPRNLKDVLGLAPTLLPLARCFPRRSRFGRPPCQEVVHLGQDVDLTGLPVPQCWPKDAGPFVTLPLVITRSLVSGRRNLGMYRLQVYDRRTTGMHWHVHKDGAHFYQEYRRAGRRMPVAVAIGADPATIYAATAPLPRNVDELLLAGFIRRKPVPMARCLTIDLEAPAEAEFVLEGYVEPDELRREGPFGDHTGYYSLADDYPVFHVTAITHRRTPVYCTTLVGRPPMEDCYLALATERLFLPLLQTAFPEIRDYWLPWEGVFHNAVVIGLDKEYPGQAQKIMHGLWGQGQMSYCKTIIVVDGEVDLKAPGVVMDRLIERLDVTTDLTLVRGVLEVLDHASPTPVYGAKIGLDLTRRFPGEPVRQGLRRHFSGPAPAPAGLAAEIAREVPGVTSARCYPDQAPPPDHNYILVLGLEKEPGRGGRYYAERLLELDSLQAFNIVVLVDAQVDLADGSRLLWKLFNQIDPERDLYRRDGRLVVDGCVKGPGDGHYREWPEELTFD